MLQVQIEPQFPAITAKAEVAPAPFEQPISFITAHGTEVCVVCHTDTGVSVREPVENRPHYVSGIGQCCEKCSPDW